MYLQAMNYTHSDLVNIAHRWALGPGGAAVAFKELVTQSWETPDVVGFGGTVSSLMIECKVSRADFLADRKKPFRMEPRLGVGTHRLYCAPEGLLRVEELPEKWALLSVGPNKKCTLAYARNLEWPQAKYLCSVYAQESSLNTERTIMLSALRRLQQVGAIEQLHPKRLQTA